MSGSSSSAGAGHSLTTPATTRAFAALEQQYGAQVGVRVLDTGSGNTLGYRDDTRFAFASTSKLLTAGLLLRTASDAELDTVVHYDAADLLSYAPVTSQHVATGMSLRDLVTAALQVSDNTAANLVTEHLGGPAAVQSALRTLGDSTTNVDRTEPDLNTATPGDVRDTTTPHALATDLRRFAVGDLLTPARRTLLVSLLEGNTTGGPYVRAGVPAGWTVGDKTGNGSYGTRNDIAVVTPPGRAPIIVVILTNRGSAQDASSDDALIADVTRQVVETVR
ncbi:class A beta-lactamase [Curtobacterium sp. Leaf261]|uniref:class A beta-lactamase n=1 Tax=Curtobacterium sp. Leaf261 TaxID=1736311 RepID=UPI001EFF4BA1|nr:class A beta-lactamase [Curtobacterium sp. Leaf261]